MRMRIVEVRTNIEVPKKIKLIKLGVCVRREPN